MERQQMRDTKAQLLVHEDKQRKVLENIRTLQEDNRTLDDARSHFESLFGAADFRSVEIYS